MAASCTGVAIKGIYYYVLYHSLSQESTSLKVSWRKCADLPIPTSSPSMVKVGENIYVSRGVTEAYSKKYIQNIFKYNIKHDVWMPLPPCKTCYHGLATLDNKLVVVGGHVAGKATGIVYTFRDGEWKEVLPPIPTPRWSLSTVSHDNRLIVAAGGTTSLKSNGEKVHTNVVEVYIKEKKSWYRTKELPFPVVQFTMCMIGDTCYTLGGTAKCDQLHFTLHASASSLHMCALPTGSRPHIPTTWKQLQDKHPLIFSSPVELGGRLFAMGGSAELRLRRGTRFISTYDFATDTWVKCKGADLPAPLYRTGVLKLDHNRVMIVGGQPKMQQFSAAVYTGTYESQN